MNEDEKKYRKAIAMLLDYAVHDCEKSDECIDAVNFAMSVLREKPNDETVKAMIECRNKENDKFKLDDFIARM